MRLFIAVNISQRSQKFIKDKVDLLKAEYQTEVKWTKKENWHLTLKFIGEASAAEKEDLILALKNIDFNEQNKYLQFSKIDCFPDCKRAKVIYLALERGRSLLESLHAKLEGQLLNLGFESDSRPYIPHLTLGRSKSKPVKISSKFRQRDFVNIYARIESISLYQSELKNDGPEYIELFTIK